MVPRLPNSPLCKLVLNCCYERFAVGKWDLLISRLVIQCDSCPATRDTYRKLGLRILLIF
jgi:hypothetical protein